MPLQLENVYRLVAVSDLAVGNMVDLEGDVFADPTGDNICFEISYAEVLGVESETPTCVRVDFDILSVGFPPHHLLRVWGHNSKPAGEG